MKKHRGKIAFAALGLVTILSVLAILAVLASDSRVALADKPTDDDGNYKGNEAPSGPHFNLNIIGMKKDKNANMDCGNGHRIFVPTETPGNGGKLPVKIMLTEAPDEVTFAVIDCDGTDGRAEFMLPNPDPNKEGCTKYSVYIRALGIPGGKAKMTTCGERCVEVDPCDPETCVVWEEVCSTEAVTLERTRGKQKFVNVSKELLTLCVEVCVDYNEVTGECEEYEYKRLYLFSEELRNYFWEYDNNGLKLAQLRFYMEETCYSEDEWECPAK